MNEKILIVDDEKGMRDLFCFSLEPYGFDIKTACDGVEAVESVKSEEFDIIFMDVHMPRMRGPEALKKIKEIRPEQIVVIFSSSSDPKYVFESEAKQHGAFDCLYKPFNIDDVTSVIERALKERNNGK